MGVGLGLGAGCGCLFGGGDGCGDGLREGLGAGGGFVPGAGAGFLRLNGLIDGLPGDLEGLGNVLGGPFGTFAGGGGLGGLVVGGAKNDIPPPVPGKFPPVSGCPSTLYIECIHIIPSPSIV